MPKSVSKTFVTHSFSFLFLSISHNHIIIIYLFQTQSTHTDKSYINYNTMIHRINNNNE